MPGTPSCKHLLATPRHELCGGPALAANETDSSQCPPGADTQDAWSTDATAAGGGGCLSKGKAKKKSQSKQVSLSGKVGEKYCHVLQNREPTVRPIPLASVSKKAPAEKTMLLHNTAPQAQTFPPSAARWAQLSASQGEQFGSAELLTRWNPSHVLCLSSHSCAPHLSAELSAHSSEDGFPCCTRRMWRPN